MASENCKSSHMAATMVGWAARRDELKRPGHERSCAVLKTLSSPRSSGKLPQDFEEGE